jgi:hypothetical protein
MSILATRHPNIYSIHVSRVKCILHACASHLQHHPLQHAHHFLLPAANFPQHTHTHAYIHTEGLKTWGGFGVGDRRGARRVQEEKLGLQDSRGMTAARPRTHRAQQLVCWRLHFSILSSLPLLNCSCAPDSGQYTRPLAEIVVGVSKKERERLARVRSEERVVRDDETNTARSITRIKIPSYRN